MLSGRVRSGSRTGRAAGGSFARPVPRDAAQAIVGDHDPTKVVLLEIDPEHQKTRCDFNVTEKLFGVRAVDIRDLRKQGNRLFHGDAPVERIYNRAIVDELERRGVELAFDWRDDIDVEWAGPPELVLPTQQVLAALPASRAAPAQFLDRGRNRNTRELVLKPLWMLRRARRGRRPDARRIAAFRRAPPRLPAAGARGFQARHRNSRRYGENRGAHHVL